jgi:hypothetical protein
VLKEFAVLSQSGLKISLLKGAGAGIGDVKLFETLRLRSGVEKALELQGTSK